MHAANPLLLKAAAAAAAAIVTATATVDTAVAAAAADPMQQAAVYKNQRHSRLQHSTHIASSLSRSHGPEPTVTVDASKKQAGPRCTTSQHAWCLSHPPPQPYNRMANPIHATTKMPLFSTSNTRNTLVVSLLLLIGRGKGHALKRSPAEYKQARATTVRPRA